MKLDEKVTLSASINHECGQFLEFAIEVRGDEAAIRNEGPRVIFESFFAGNFIHWKAHGTRVKKCPTCGKPLPADIDRVNDAEFK